MLVSLTQNPSKTPSTLLWTIGETLVLYHKNLRILKPAHCCHQNITFIVDFAVDADCVYYPTKTQGVIDLDKEKPQVTLCVTAASASLKKEAAGVAMLQMCYYFIVRLEDGLMDGWMSE